MMMKIFLQLQSNFSPDVEVFINAVINPFTSNPPCCVPDVANEKSIPLYDYISDIEIISPINGCIGTLIFSRIGYSNESTASTDNTVYSTHVYTISPGGKLSTNPTVITTDNYSIITGNSTDVNLDVSLVDSMRIYSMGLKVLPIIETVTSDSTTIINSVFATQLSANEVYTCVTTNVSIFNYLHDAPSTVEYSNALGASVRYDPFQVEQQLTLMPLKDFNQQMFDWSNVRLPTLLVLFNHPVAITVSFPFKLHTSFWIDAILKEQSPIFPSLFTPDINFEQTKALLSSMQYDSILPLSTIGHTFKDYKSYKTSVNKKITKLIHSSSPFGKMLRKKKNVILTKKNII